MGTDPGLYTAQKVPVAVQLRQLRISWVKAKDY